MGHADHAGRDLPADVRDRLAGSFPDLDLDRVRIGAGLPSWTAFAPVPVAAITLGDRIHVDPEVDLDSPEGIALLAHELVHVAQWRRAGRRGPIGLRWTAFPIRYVWAYLLARWRGLDPAAAYRAIPYEREAYDVQRTVLSRAERSSSSPHAPAD